MNDTYAVNDADNHLYETRDAFSRFLPPEYADLVRFVNIDGKDQLLVDKKLCFILPNPTLEKVAPPGKYEKGDELPRVIVSPPQFFEPGPRLSWMRETGLDRAIVFPTIGLSIEERLQNPEKRVVLTHAYNEWLLDQWTFNYEEALFPTPIITLSDMDAAIREVAWIAEQGARAFYLMPGLPLDHRGRRSMALEQYDPFWRVVEDSGMVVGMHAGDGGQHRYWNEWEGENDSDPAYFKKRSPGSMLFRSFLGGMYERVTMDLIGSMICHGLLSRFPKLTILPAEQGTSWVRPTCARLEELWGLQRPLFEENPIEVFRRNVKVHLFKDPDPVGLVRLVGVETCVFGSDFPHPEGQENPLDFADRLPGLPTEEIALIMGGNLDKAMGIDATSPA